MKAGKQQSKRAIPERLSGIISEKDRQEALETLGRAFSRPDFIEHHLLRTVWKGSLYKPEYTRIAVAGGRVVSAVAMAPRTIRFGPARVSAMTIGPVGTHDHFRKKGYSAAAINEASDWMKSQGVQVAYLQGIQEYYYRFGYFPFAARNTVKLSREAARKQAGKAKFRVMKRRDLSAVSELYEACAAQHSCTAYRDGELWDWLMGPGRQTWFFHNPKLILDSRGRLCGYFTNNSKDQLDVREIIVRPDEPSCRAALGALVAEARRREVKEINLPLAWDDCLAVFLRQFVSAEFHAWTDPTGGALMKIVNFDSLMQELLPMFAARWQAARRALPAVQFTLESEIGSAGFQLSKGGVKIASASGKIVHVPQRWLSGLLTGYYSIKDIAARDGVRIPPDLAPALAVLFPACCPFVYQADNY
ncbi:MAG TPA: GNAT family N-acetyltransferase [Planctomycetota bacterium]|nr:GNAT family N-acetyltransferase [Planctomycetota bacterium]